MYCTFRDLAAVYSIVCYYVTTICDKGLEIPVMWQKGVQDIADKSVLFIEKGPVYA